MMPAVSFRTKVTLLLSAVVLILGATAIFYARRDMEQVLGSELEERGVAIARELASNGVEPLLTDDLVGLHHLVNRARNNNPDVRYVVITSPEGDVLVDTFANGVPEGLLQANVPPPGADWQLRRLATEEGLIRDVAASMLGGYGGVVRVGMSDRGVRAAVATNSRTLILLVVAAVGAGILVAYWISCYLARPLTRLLSAVQWVAQGDFTQRIATPSGDEWGQLERAFNTMARELEAKEAARRDLMAQVISSQEEERKRVARELHDELAQQLTSVLYSLEAIEAGDSNGASTTKEAIARARRNTESSLTETRKLISDLRPTVLDDIGLVPAIRSCAETHLQPHGVRVVVRARKSNGLAAPQVETAVFRITQEAISNILRHAEAHQAWISLDARDGSLWGEVVDDGRGFSTNERNPDGGPGARLGLRGMAERATLLGGDLRVTSAPGKGTTVSFQIPLRPEGRS